MAKLHLSIVLLLSHHILNISGEGNLFMNISDELYQEVRSEAEVPDVILKEPLNVPESLKEPDIIPKGYDPTKPPVMKPGVPVEVKISLIILTIRSVVEDKSAITVDIFFYQEWLEPRIIFPHKDKKRIVLESSWKSKLWIPDTYFKNSYSGAAHNIISPETYILLYSNNMLFYASRIALTFSCAMRLETYPHDVQKCQILIGSLQRTTDTVVLLWNEFRITPRILLAQFDVQLLPTGNCTKYYENLGSYSCICGGIRLARRLGYYIMNRYIPSFLIVIMSFVTFWLPAEAYPARIALPVTSLLSLVTQLHKSSMPNVSYVMAINVWMSSCIAFIFFTLLEYALVIAVMDRRKEKEKKMRELKSYICETGEKIDEKALLFHPLDTYFYMSHVDIDRFSRILFPVIYFIFALSYGIIYGV